MAMKSLASLSYRVSLIARTQRTRFDQRARSIGITLSQWRAIFAISIDEGTSQRRIAETIDVGDVAAGRLVDRLVDNGWVERRADPADRRTHRLYLTSAARPLLDRLAALGQSEEAMALEGLDPRDIDVALAVLDRVIANLERASEASETCRDPGDLD
jgi:MarR family transcriptional regulator, transcriptional regulator for hemolysin